MLCSSRQLDINHRKNQGFVCFHILPSSAKNIALTISFPSELGHLSMSCPPGLGHRISLLSPELVYLKIFILTWAGPPQK